MQYGDFHGSYLLQSGNGNNADVYQDGFAGHTSSVIQDGNNGDVDVTQN